jgi:DNA-binding MarR family transcriptional regulator
MSNLFHQLRTVTHMVQKAAEKQCRRTLRIPLAEALVLKYIIDNQHRTNGEIALAFNLNRSAVTGLLNRMERNELIHRTQSDDDGRIHFVYPSIRGHEMKDRLCELAASYEEQMSVAVPEQDRLIVEQFLVRLNRGWSADIRDSEKPKPIGQHGDL